MAANSVLILRAAIKGFLNIIKISVFKNLTVGRV